MKYIGGKVLDNDGTEMPMYKLNQIVKSSEAYAYEARQKKEKSKEFVKKQKSKKVVKKVEKELTTDDITKMLSKNTNFKVIKK